MRRNSRSLSANCAALVIVVLFRKLPRSFLSRGQKCLRCERDTTQHKFFMFRVRSYCESQDTRLESRTTVGKIMCSGGRKRGDRHQESASNKLKAAVFGGEADPH